MRKPGKKSIPQNKMKVLIVEDDALTINLFKLVVELTGMTSDAVTDGEQAIKALSGALVAPDIVILDIHLPIVSGDEVFTYLRAHHPKTKVVVVTADTKKVRYYMGVADASLPKPFYPRDMVKTLQSLCKDKVATGK
jgi:DNA-binding response OmpR family regulator